MDDAFNRDGGLRLRRRFNRESRLQPFSPSYGVRNGFVADVERELPPEIRNLRSSQRLPMSFDVVIDGTPRRVSGNVSAGGVMILSASMIRQSQLEVVVTRRDGSQVRVHGTLIGVHRVGDRYATHVRFDAPNALAEVVAEQASADR